MRHGDVYVAMAAVVSFLRGFGQDAKFYPRHRRGQFSGLLFAFVAAFPLILFCLGVILFFVKCQRLRLHHCALFRHVCHRGGQVVAHVAKAVVFVRFR